MQDQREAEINLEMDIADFSGKTVKRIDIQNVVNRTDAHKGGIAIVISFTDGATGTILVRSRNVPVIAAPYARPRMADYSIVQEDSVVQVP
jgi:hypothetical protein